MKRKPDIENLYKILRREKPNRPTLFELFLNTKLYALKANPLYILALGKTRIFKWMKDPLSLLEDQYAMHRILVRAFYKSGYDYATVWASNFRIKNNREDHNIAGNKKSYSLNEGGVISDRESFNNFKWPEPSDFDFSHFEKMKKHLPKGMKLMPTTYGGIFETVTDLIGYDKMCYMLYEDPELLEDIFNKVGERYLEHYKLFIHYDTVGIVMCNDDWGFNSQTLLPPDALRKYVFPWYKKIVKEIHKAGKYAILHSCGNLVNIMDDIIDDMKFDAKHSYQDIILPVEEAYKKYGDRIAILGGIDVDFMSRETPENISKRAKALLKLTEKGGYALGTGNSLTEYTPLKNILAMQKVATKYK